MAREREELTTAAPGFGTNGNTNGGASQPRWGGAAGGWGGMGSEVAAGSVLAPAGGWLRTFESLQIPEFRIYWVGMLFSFIGMQVGMLARQWLVYDLTGSTTALGVVGAVSGIPMLLLSIPGGVMANRVSRRTTLIVVQAITCTMCFLIGFLILTGKIQIWHIVAASLIGGATMTFNMPARQAMIAALVGPEKLMNAVSLNSAGMNLTRIIAPTVAGILVAAVGLTAAYFVHASSFLIAIMLLLMLPVTVGRIQRWQRNSALGDAVEGLKYVLGNRLVLSLMLLATVPAIFAMPYQMLLPVYARDILKVGPTGLGMMMSVTGAGALLGALALASVGELRAKGKIMIIAAVSFGSMIALFALAPYLTRFGVSLPGVFILSLGLLGILGVVSQSYMALNNTTVMLAIPDEVRGRVMGVYMMTWGFMPLGVLPVGILGDVIGVPIVLAAGGLLMAATSLLIWLAVPELRHLQ